MALAKKLDRPKALEIHLPTSIREKLDTELIADGGIGKVPFGAYTILFTDLSKNWLRLRGYKF